MAPFDYDNCAKASEDFVKETQELIEEISNVTMHQRAISQLGIDQSLLPVSALKKEVLIEAKEILIQTKRVVNELEELRKEGLKADQNKVEAVNAAIQKHSNDFYRLIPLSEHKDSITRPMNQIHLVDKMMLKINQLVEIEHASRLLLAALYRQYVFNPIEYVYNSLGVKL